MNKEKIAVFLDRDGTLIHEVDYLKDIKDLKLYDETPDAIKKLNEANILTIMVSNQSGVARGYFDEENVKLINNSMNDLLKAQGAYLDGVYYCPHHLKGSVTEYQIDCNCRKPLTGMIDQALRDFPDINIQKSYVIGDKPCDVDLAKNAGAIGILVKTGHGSEYNSTHCSPDFVAENMTTAIEWILKNLS